MSASPTGPRVLTSRELEVLDALPSDRWVRPMDIGGKDGSHHSNTLAKLVRYGLAEHERHYIGVSGGHWRYRRVDMVKQAISHVRVLAGYECAGSGDALCGSCGPCEANAFLRRWGLL